LGCMCVSLGCFAPILPPFAALNLFDKLFSEFSGLAGRKWVHWEIEGVTERSLL